MGTAKLCRNLPHIPPFGLSTASTMLANCKSELSTQDAGMSCLALEDRSNYGN